MTMLALIAILCGLLLGVLFATWFEAGRARLAAEAALKKVTLLEMDFDHYVKRVVKAALQPDSGTQVYLPLNAVLEAVKRLEKKEALPNAGETLSQTVPRIALRVCEEAMESQADNWEDHPPDSIVNIVSEESSGAPDRKKKASQFTLRG